MSKSLSSSIVHLHIIEDIANQNSWLHRRHPLCKLLVTICFLFFVISFGKYDVAALLPYIFYPLLVMVLGDIPATPIFKRTLIAAPFVLGIGIFNPVFDTAIHMTVFGLPISGGWISFASLFIKMCLTVLAGLLLLATTSSEKLAQALRMLHFPKIFVLQLLLTYRYLTLLAEEAARMHNAYMLRAPGQKHIEMKIWSSLIGQLLLRTMDRGQRIYQAMKLRGFTGEYNSGHLPKFNSADLIYTTAWLAFFIIARFYSIPQLIGSLIMGVLS